MGSQPLELVGICFALGLAPAKKGLFARILIEPNLMVGALRIELQARTLPALLYGTPIVELNLPT